MARFKSIQGRVYGHLYGTVTADGRSYSNDYRIFKRRPGYYTVQFNSPFYGDPGVSCTLNTENQEPYVGATSVKIIDITFQEFTYCTLKGDEPCDSGVTFIVFGSQSY